MPATHPYPPPNASEWPAARIVAYLRDVPQPSDDIAVDFCRAWCRTLAAEIARQDDRLDAFDRLAHFDANHELHLAAHRKFEAAQADWERSAEREADARNTRDFGDGGL